MAPTQQIGGDGERHGIMVILHTSASSSGLARYRAAGTGTDGGPGRVSRRRLVVALTARAVTRFGSGLDDLETQASLCPVARWDDIRTTAGPVLVRSGDHRR